MKNDGCALCRKVARARGAKSNDTTSTPTLSALSTPVFLCPT